MALTAEDAQIMAEKVIEFEAAQGINDELQHDGYWHHHQHGTSEDNLETKTVGSSIKSGDEQPLTYRYLEWDTPIADLCGDSQLLLPPALLELRNPVEWGRERKAVVLAICCASTFVAAYSAGAYVAGVKQMEALWGVSKVALLVGVTTFTTGFATAPMLLAPLSEVYGRLPVFLASFALFNVAHLACALCRSFPGMLVARFFSGVGCSTFSTICGGVIADLYMTDQRSFPMACFSTVAMFGTGMGPLVSGFIAQNLSWRWIHWLQLIVGGVLMAIVVLAFKEPRGSVILIRKAKVLNRFLDEHDSPDVEKPGPRVRWRVRAEEERASLRKMIRVSLTRPFYLLFTEPVVFSFSVWVSFSWGVLYLFLQGVPLVFSSSHHFTVEQSGAVFTSMCVGSLVALFLNLLVEKAAKRFLPHASGPETRLYSSCTLGCFLPIGMFWFGWTSFPSIPWIVPAISVGISTIGIFVIYLAVFNYFADTYHRYASSALAAQSFCRNMLGGCFPLITPAMFNNMTFQGASSLLGGLGALLSIVPWVLVFYGTRIRARSKFAKDITS